jgi:hypothetical protein
MFVDEEDIVLEAGVEVGFESQMYYHRIMVTVDMRIYTVESLEDLLQ